MDTSHKIKVLVKSFARFYKFDWLIPFSTEYMYTHCIYTFVQLTWFM